LNNGQQIGFFEVEFEYLTPASHHRHHYLQEAILMADDGREIILAQMESSFNAISQAKASRSTRLQT
jgi:hypothetical protein